MLTFVIVILSLNVVRTLNDIPKQKDSQGGIASILAFASQVLALIFACNL